jgi:hypothetical protein
MRTRTDASNSSKEQTRKTMSRSTLRVRQIQDQILHQVSLPLVTIFHRLWLLLVRGANRWRTGIWTETCKLLHRATYDNAFQNEIGIVTRVGSTLDSWIVNLSVIQEVNFQSPNCLSRYGTVQHEMMHVLGFHHEHSRSDRWVSLKNKAQSPKLMNPLILP